MKFPPFHCAAAILIPVLLAATPAAAEDDAGQVEVSAMLAVVSDYRFRGVTLSDGKPALQGGVEIENGGWFAGGWASTIRGSTLRGRNDTGVEIDAYAGRRGQSGGFRYALTGYAYLTGLDQPVFVEVQTLVGHRVGPGELELELSYAPRQHGGTDNLYLGARASVPLARTGFSIIGRAGYEHGYFDRKFDWDLGASWSRGPLILTAALTGARQRRLPQNRATRPAAVFSILRTW